MFNCSLLSETCLNVYRPTSPKLYLKWHFGDESVFQLQPRNSEAREPTIVVPSLQMLGFFLWNWSTDFDVVLLG